MGERPVLVLINRGGGTAKTDPDIGATVRDAFRESGVSVEVELVDGARIVERCKEAVRRGDPSVVVGGGDGTIGAAAGVLAGSDTVLGILPLGTLNHFARDLGIGVDLDDAVKTIAAGSRRRVDLAEVNGRPFVNNSAIGLYPLMVADREGQQHRLGRGKKLALFIASLRTLARFKRHRLRLVADDNEERVETPLLFVGNNDYRTDLAAAGKRDRLDDGRLYVLAMASRSRRAFFLAGLRALFGRSREHEMLELKNVRRLRVDSRRRSLEVSIDGEVAAMKPPLDYRIRPKALSVFAP